MKEHIRYIFPNGLLLQEDVTGRLPADCRLRVSYARAGLYHLPEGRLLVQHYTHVLFYIETLEFNLHSELVAEYELPLSSLFLFSMLQGIVNFYTPEQNLIYDASNDLCYGTFNQQGKYVYVLGPGLHRVFFMIPNVDLIQQHSAEYPELSELLQNMKNGADRFGHMPECAMKGTLFQLTLSLLAYRLKAGEDLEIKLLERGKAVLLEYHRVVALNLNQSAYRIRRYLEKNYADSELSNDSIAKEFKISKRSLTRVFKAIFRISPHAYLINVRLSRAKELLNEKKMPVSEIYKIVGYKDLRSFRSQFHKKFGDHPSGSY